MAFLKDIQDKIILGRWRFLNLKKLSGTTKQLGIDNAGVLGLVDAGETSVSWEDIENKPETFAPIIGTTADTAKAGDWTPAAGDIPNLSASKITGGTFAEARIPNLSISKVTGLQTALDEKVTQAEVIAYLQGLDGYAAGAVLTATADGFEWTTL